MAKEAADIVILDDNFSSIVKSVLWGRSVFGNIRKFLQFQLTVNGVALVLAFIAAITNGETPLNVLQLLWVNLIMDALGALGAPLPPALKQFWICLEYMCAERQTPGALWQDAPVPGQGSGVVLEAGNALAWRTRQYCLYKLISINAGGAGACTACS